MSSAKSAVKRRPRLRIARPWMLADRAAYERVFESATALVAAEYQLTAEALHGRMRTARIAWARQVLHWLVCKAGIHPSYAATQFKRDRTTVLHSIKTVRYARENYPLIKLETDILLEKFVAQNQGPVSSDQ